ncbi:B12-binding domain-containing radical SAM protein [Actinoplanes ianthinogenes]|uniref:B12-binding domain-containing radical SAM protein n=1 Tax=Actinoplanes ianthinogenes TaxID=122358 RepID=UPI00166FC8FE|nr:radical SAM protein [Actinoplanes ianthinogenes]
MHDYAHYPRTSTPHSPPLGILSIATAADRAGFRVEVLDAELERLSPEAIVEAVRARRPRWVGINSFSINIDIVSRIVGLVCQEPTRVVVGGPHITNVSDELVAKQFGPRAVYVRGDGERAVLELIGGADPAGVPGVLTGKAAGLPGAAMISTSITVRPTYVDVTAMPMIDRRFSRGEPFERLGRRWYGLTMSRGCLFRCAFCAGSSHSSGIPYRVSSYDSVFREVDYLVGLGATGIRVFDDLPFKGKRPLLDFLGQAHRRYGDRLAWELSFPLQYGVGLSADEWRHLSEYGLATVISGVEAADMTLRYQLGKRVTDGRIWDIVNGAARSGIDLRFYFIIGLPGESRESTEQTLSFARDLASVGSRSGRQGVRCLVFGYKPMPGSALWADLLRAGHTEEELLSFTDFTLTVPEFQKHAWRSSLTLSELNPEEISQMIDEFYVQTQTFNSDLMTTDSPMV